MRQCVLHPDVEAVTDAVDIPVCGPCWRIYLDELESIPEGARLTEPGIIVRPFFTSLCEAEQKRTEPARPADKHKRPFHPAMLATSIAEALGLDPCKTKSIDLHIDRNGMRVEIAYAMDRKSADSLMRVFRSVDFKEEGPA